MKPLSAIVLLATTMAMAGTTGAEVRVATGNDYAPFTDEDLPEGGLATELVVRAFEAAGADSIDVDFRPWARGFHDTAQGLFAGTFPYVYTDDRAERVQYAPTPLASIENIVVSSADSPVDYDGVESLTGLDLCRPLGYALPGVIEQHIEDGHINASGVSEIESCPRMIEMGRADYFVATNFTWPGLVAGLGLNDADFHVAEQPVEAQALHFISAHGDDGDQAIAQYEQGMAILHDSGEYEEIFNRHIVEEQEGN